MDRNEAISAINGRLAAITDDQLAALAELTASLPTARETTVFETLTDEDKRAIDAAADAIARGEGRPWSEVSARLEKKLRAAEV